MKKPILHIESFTYKKGDPIPNMSHHFEEIYHVYGDKLDYTHLLFNVQKQIENGTGDEMSVFYYTLDWRNDP